MLAACANNGTHYLDWYVTIGTVFLQLLTLFCLALEKLRGSLI